MDVKNSSFDVEFNFTFDLITLHFVAAKTGPNTRFYGDKILHKNLKNILQDFRANILPSKML